jgi:hypothetical protein
MLNVKGKRAPHAAFADGRMCTHATCCMHTASSAERMHGARTCVLRAHSEQRGGHACCFPAAALGGSSACEACNAWSAATRNTQQRT